MKQYIAETIEQYEMYKSDPNLKEFKVHPNGGLVFISTNFVDNLSTRQRQIYELRCLPDESIAKTLNISVLGVKKHKKRIEFKKKYRNGL